jgi:hypothetical protein
MYQTAYDELLKTGMVRYDSTLNLKFDEMFLGDTMRTVTAFENSFVVSVGPDLHRYSTALKQAWNGYNNMSRSDKYSLHILYASGVSDSDMARITLDNMTVRDKPHYFLKVLGDDTALSRIALALCCDFSRYDSTQHEYHHEMFRNVLLNKGLAILVEHLRSGARGNTAMYNEDTKEKINLTMVGLKTGTPETSVSNTTVTGLSIMAALEEASKTIDMSNTVQVLKFVENFLKESCGFLPKGSIQSYNRGVEFLKRIQIVQDNYIVTIPLLSALVKIGKFLKHPYTIYPKGFQRPSHAQMCVDLTLMQLIGKGDLNKIPGWKIWYRKLLKISPMKDPYDIDYNGPIETQEVTIDTIDRAYSHRYDVGWDMVESLFNGLAKQNVKDYPFTYTSDILSRAVNIDYGTNIS